MNEVHKAALKRYWVAKGRMDAAEKEYDEAIKAFRAAMRDLDSVEYQPSAAHTE